MQARASRDFGEGKPAPLELQDLAMGRRALFQHQFPELVSLCHLARPGLTGVSHVPGVGLMNRSFLFKGAMVLPAAIDQPVTGDLQEESPKVRSVLESPAGLAKSAQDVGPYRLDDIHR